MSIRCHPTSLVLVGLFLWVTACTSYKQIELGEIAHHEKIRVATTDGLRETIHSPRVEADSIKGGESEAVSLDQVAEVESAQTDWYSTGVLIGVGALVVGLITARVVECATNEYGSEC